MEQKPDFVVGCESQDVMEYVLEEVGNWWRDLGQEQQNDYLSAWDELSVGDHTWVGDYEAVCHRPACMYGYPKFEILVH